MVRIRLIVRQKRCFNLGMATNLKEGKSVFKPAKLRLKIDPVADPAQRIT